MDLKFFDWARGYLKAGPSETPALPAEYNGVAALMSVKHSRNPSLSHRSGSVPGPCKVLTYSEKGHFAAEDSL